MLSLKFRSKSNLKFIALEGAKITNENEKEIKENVIPNNLFTLTTWRGKRKGNQIKSNKEILSIPEEENGRKCVHKGEKLKRSL